MDAIQQALRFNPIVFIGQIVLFLALLHILNAIFWKPILAHLSQRDQDVSARYTERERLQHEMEALRADYLARIAVVEGEARAHIQSAVREAQATRERLLAEAREQAESTIRHNVTDIESEQVTTLQALHEKMTDLATNVADAALASTAERETLRRSVETGIHRGITDTTTQAPGVA